MNYDLGFNRAATSLLVAPHYIVLSRKLSHYIPVKLSDYLNMSIKCQKMLKDARHTFGISFVQLKT